MAAQEAGGPPAQAKAPAKEQAATAPAVVVAIDTSRSLARPTLQAAFEPLRRALAALPSDCRVGLLAFDDEARWIVPVGATPAAVAERLADLDPQGRHTLLNDALFAAGEALPEGGVVLLATDGRDENSATTVDDIARRFEDQRVRVVAVGLGRSLDERALRRLALLSRGSYLGKAEALDAAGLAKTLGDHRGAIAAQRAEEVRKAEPPPRPAPVVAQPAAPVQPAAAPAPTTADRLLDFLPWILTGVLALLFLLVIASRQRAAQRSREAEVEEQRQYEEAQIADEAEAAAIRVELAQVPPAAPRESPEVTVDTAVLQRVTLDERLDRTRVLSSMVILRKPGESPRSFLLDRDKSFAVGRDKEKNTLAIPDPSISAQHFKIVPRGGVYYFVDLESTNGSYLGGRRVRAKRLRSGDVVRAGQVDFEFQSYGE